MMRTVFYIVSAVALVVIGLVSFAWPPILWALVIVVPLILIGIYDILWAGHNVLHNYPVIGHLRYALEFISPEIHQYFIESNEDGKPYNRLQRHLVYARAQAAVDTQPFGTQRDLMDVGFIRASHSLAPKEVPDSEARIVVGGTECKKPYSASRLNISAMSFGALSPTAIHALNAGARRGNFAHNTGEGGLSPYHLAGGGDIIFQIGTGYFGCRTPEGKFDEDKFVGIANNEVVRMIEIKLSQGAKPAHGGVLPAAKVDEEISRIRGVPMGQDVISPPAHTTFSTPEGLLQWVARLRELSGGKPIGFKLCIGRRHEFMGIVKAMLETGILPDFITVDGAEGGTGAAPFEFTDRLGVPINEGLSFVQSCLVGASLRDELRLIASGKVVTGFNMVEKISLGADMCNVARPMLFALGCIQAVRCNTNTCPTGIATQDRRRAKAVDIRSRQKRVANFHNATIESFLDLVGAMGLTSPAQLSPDLIYQRVADETERAYDEIYPLLEPGELLGKKINPAYADHWARASAQAF
ncbi:FMN-binding glutamate synthase family protein [Hoeflea prorocentri]|uniref:FMN-binding glutamate synthase family protein n=1 Tax=Hoeflea prorocentri TaxID=1922333 RepID=A0A9X3UIN9_9HYPH|nr:FMN-binding glutamate synthase family protein [Hoeflea prorocentri]MCY6381140.1 FMN-binding glutamate synthase family protein [Hoeflea prorocentri]MDA5398940.1 FMN-binding glutamate synthase family protein [Hoeflea prorocentri]